MRVWTRESQNEGILYILRCRKVFLIIAAVPKGFPASEKNTLFFAPKPRIHPPEPTMGVARRTSFSVFQRVSSESPPFLLFHIRSVVK